MSSYGCQQNLIGPDRALKSILEFVCEESNKLANCGLYYSRQLYFKTGKFPSKATLHRLMKDNLHFKALYSHVAQQTLTSVAESFQSYIGLLKGIKNGTVMQRPKLPGYRKNSLKLATFPKADVKLKNGQLRFPLGSKVKLWFGVSEFYLPMPTNLDYGKIREIRILPKNGQFYAEFVYKIQSVAVELDASKVLGIDPGLNNWLTCISNVGTSLIVDGLHLKSLNQWYNKRVATIKEYRPQGFWSKRLARITEKRNRQVRDAVNKAARLVLNHCLENQIGTVVFGWNKGMRQLINLGSKTNQSFVQIPTARLKDRISQLCEQHGIRFVETEESYTSKASFLDSDELPKFGEKPEGWKESGKRVNRGLYRSKDGSKINADCNAAANILRKVATTLGLCLKGVSRGALISTSESSHLDSSRIPVPERAGEYQINSLSQSTHSLKQMAVYKKSLLVFSTLLIAGLAVAAPLRALSAETSVQVNPENNSNLDSLLRKGRELVDVGDYGKAIAIYEQAARLDAENPRIFSGIGYLEARQGNYQAAVEFYQQAIGLEPKNADFQYALGYAMANLQNYPAAATAYRRAAQLDRKNVNALIGLGVVLFQQQDYSGAFKAYQQAIALDPKNWQAYSSMGLVLIQQGNFPSAVDVLQQAAKLAPKQASVQLKLGTALLRSGNTSEGLAAFEEAAKLEPRNADVQLEIGELLRTQNDLDGALVAYQRAITVRPNLVQAHAAIGEIQLEKQDLLGAIITFRRVIGLDPTRAEAYYNLGTALKGRDRTSEAVEAFKQALDIYRQQGNNDGAQKAEAALKQLK